jgi:hypothetical protein
MSSGLGFAILANRIIWLVTVFIAGSVLTYIIWLTNDQQ